MRRLNPLKWFGRIADRLRNWREPRGLYVRLTASQRASVLLEVCLCIRTGQLDLAQGLLLQLEGRDTARLNLLGAIAELRHDWPLARSFYGQAIRADSKSASAQQNMRRWYELVTLGSSTLPMLLGDEEPQWWHEREEPSRPGPETLRNTAGWVVSTAGERNSDVN